LGADRNLQFHHDLWAAGSYERMAELHSEPCMELVQRVGVRSGLDVLDVAAGTGNTAVAAAKTGATVTALDLIDRLLRAAAQRAAADGVRTAWVRGDAQKLPFVGARFDVVLSSFGVGWAPNHDETARELVRVCRPGGLIGLCHWTPEGFPGQGIQVQAAALPPPPPFRTWLWGSDVYLEELFAPAGVVFEFMRGTTTWSFPSVDALLAHMDENSGPAILAGEQWESRGERDEVRRLFYQRMTDINQATDGTWRADAEYLLAVGRTSA
jgi:SAM-dependent methyltransferase